MSAPATVGAALAGATRALAAAGVPAPGFEARLLVAHALAVGVEAVIGYPERTMPAGESARLAALVARRAAREPMAYVLGRREFWSLEIGVGADVLVPRPDSETVIEAALAGVGDREAALSVLDLGTGSGCLLLALLAELPRARGVGVDRSPAALAVARANARALGLAGRAAFVGSDWTAALAGRFDVVVANPPYVPGPDIDAGAPELAFEPRLALDGGGDGLAAYRALVPGLGRVLAPGAVVALEVGAGQAATVAGMMRAAGIQDVEIKPDLAGRGRCVAGRACESDAVEKKGWKPNVSRLVSDRLAVEVPPRRRDASNETSQDLPPRRRTGTGFAGGEKRRAPSGRAR